MDAVKFVRDYFHYDYETRTKKLISRWHFDLKKFANGPVLVEEFDLNEKETKKRKKKDISES
jgi:2-oxoglutarate dehydrogenase complex dehydrogenase (E1) component-like enzyme